MSGSEGMSVRRSSEFSYSPRYAPPNMSVREYSNLHLIRPFPSPAKKLRPCPVNARTLNP